MNKLIVFTDLDGSLLNHNTYDWSQASTAINVLKDKAFPLILNSSKTSKEINLLRDELGNSDPYICENGALLHINENMQETSSSRMGTIYFAKPHTYIKETLNIINKHNNFDMYGFSDMDVHTLMELTGLDEINANAAKQREASEPLIWNDSDESLTTFKTILQEHDLALTRGGRFYHVTSPVSKGDSVSWLINKYQEIEPQTNWITAALGDSYNDIPMLEQVEYPVLIKNPHSTKPNIDHIENLIESKLEGPAGWNIEVLNIIKKATGEE